MGRIKTTRILLSWSKTGKAELLHDLTSDREVQGCERKRVGKWTVKIK